MRNSRRLAKVTLLVTIMLLAPIAGGVGAAGSTAPDDTSTDDSEFVTPQEGVSIWKQSPVSLQADTADANVSVGLPSVFVETTGNYYEGKLNRSEVGVYETNEQITLRFGNDVDATDFDGNAQLVTLYDDSPINEALMNDSADGTLEDRILDRMVGTSDADIEGGEFTTTKSLNQGPGYYTFIVTDVDISDGMPEDVTVFGAEQAVVQDEPTSVDVTSDDPEPGDNITFDVDATAFDGNEVEHSVVLYDESNFTDSNVTVTVPDDVSLGAGLGGDDVSIETDIGSINGVQTVSDEAGRQNISRNLALGNVVELVMGNQDDIIQTGDRQLNASSTAVLGDANEEITVETFGNWSETDYRWIHVATSTDSSSDRIQANAGTLQLGTSGGGGGGGGGGGIGGGIGGGGSPADPEFEVTKAGLSSGEIAAGDEVDVTAKIEEVSGDRGGQFTAELTVDGEVVDEETVTVFAGESENVTFTRSFDEVGEYEIAVNDAPAGTLTVSETGPGGPGSDGSFEVSETSLSSTDLGVGDELEVSATVENTGSEAGTFTAELTVDGQVVAEQTVTLNAGDSETVTFTHSFDEAGEFDIAVSETAVGTVTVSDGSGLMPVPGFGMGAALVALLAVALLGARLQE